MCPFLWGIGAGLIMVPWAHEQKAQMASLLICSVVLAQLTLVTNKRTHKQTRQTTTVLTVSVLCRAYAAHGDAA